MVQTRLAVVILHYGEQGHTANCAQAVQNAIRTAGESCLAEIYVVDNNDNAPSPQCADGKSENIKTIRSGSNLGFAAGMNLGIHAAIQNNCDYLWLLNNDTVVDELSIKTLIEHAKCHPAQKWIGCTVMDPATNQVATIGGYQYSAMLSAARPIKGPGRAPDYIDGAAMLLCADTVEQLGGLPQHNFMYFEELYLARALESKDLSWGVCEASKVWHIGGNSTKALSLEERTYHLTTAALGYTGRHAKPFLITVWATRFIKAVFDSTVAFNFGGIKGFCRASLHHLFQSSNN